MNENLISKQARLEWLDFCRGIAIILVVAGHTGSLGPLTKIIYSFHMPLFAMITGFLYNAENERLSISVYIKKIYRKYIKPLVFFGT